MKTFRMLLLALAGGSSMVCYAALSSSFARGNVVEMKSYTADDTGLKVMYNTANGEYNLQVDEQTWISGGVQPVTVPGYHLDILHADTTTGNDVMFNMTQKLK